MNNCDEARPVVLFVAVMENVKTPPSVGVPLMVALPLPLSLNTTPAGKDATPPLRPDAVITTNGPSGTAGIVTVLDCPAVNEASPIGASAGGAPMTNLASASPRHDAVSRRQRDRDRAARGRRATDGGQAEAAVQEDQPGRHTRRCA